MSFELSRLRGGEVIAGTGSVILLASLFVLPWYRVGAAVSLDGWHGLTHLRWLSLVTVIAGAALVYLQAARRAPALPVTVSVFVTVLGALTALWLIYRVLIDPPSGQQVGAYVGLLGACAIAYGGYASMRQEGIATADEPQEIPTVGLPGQDGS
ncbi:MAG: hypothetical protein JO206_09070 [Solirubrobacterales bacterium]|nr:hypothetical protein [Solirubrobacterales bacterium]MBV9473109.1 hypothetical protein [Solirubrobacterales bacterium]